MARLGVGRLHLPASTWTRTEAGAFSALGSVANMWATGGWVRDKVLECTDVNPAANRSWQHLRGLAGYPPGDLDLLVDQITAREFHTACLRNEPLCAALRGPPTLVPARGKRPLDTVKLKLPELDVDVTSLLDTQKLLLEAKEVLPSTNTSVECDVQTTNINISGLDSLKAEAEHRDTTFNALYYNFMTQEVLDPCGQGLPDLRSGIVRVPHSSGVMATIKEDPVRLLRAFRFASRFGFELDGSLADGLEQSSETLLAFRCTSPGRLLNEVKKALLLHNKPSRFLGFLGGPSEVHRHFFSTAGDALLATSAWQAAVGRVRRLEALVLEGIQCGSLTSRSVRWRGRGPDGPAPALFAPDWRKTGVWENDWAELLFAALYWRCDSDAIRKVGAQLQISSTMSENVVALLNEAKRGPLSVQTSPPGAYLLNNAVASAESPTDFWCRWPRIKPASASETA